MQHAHNILSEFEIDHTRDPEILTMMREIYPALNEQELNEAKENLERYLKLAWRIAERIVRESEKASFDSTLNNSYDDTKVDNTHPHH
jgi:Tfp pilus assembly protein PilF